MKYKAGDRVAIRKDKPFPQGIRMVLEKYDYTVTITGIGQVFDSDNYYYLKEFEENWAWTDNDIECVDKSEPINNRFDILDL